MRRMEVHIVILLFLLHVNIMFGVEEITDIEFTNDSSIKPLSHYKLKLKAKFKEKVVPTAAKEYTTKKLKPLRIKEAKLHKLPTNINWTKILGKKPKLKLKPSGILNYLPFQTKKSKDNDTTERLEKFKETFTNYLSGSSNEETFSNYLNGSNEFRDSIVSDDLQKSSANQKHWIMLFTTERPSSISTTNKNFRYTDDTWFTYETTFRPIRTTAREEPSILDEIDLDTNEIGPRPTPIIKNETEEMIGLLTKLREMKDPKKAGGLNKELLEQTNKDDLISSSENKLNASMFDEPDSETNDDIIEIRPTQKPNTDKQLHDVLKSLIQQNKVNKTWLLNELGISTEQAIKEKPAELTEIDNFTPIIITETNFYESNGKTTVSVNKPFTLFRIPAGKNMKSENEVDIQSETSTNVPVYFPVEETPEANMNDYVKEEQRLLTNYHETSTISTCTPTRTMPRHQQTTLELTIEKLTSSFPDDAYEETEDKILSNRKNKNIWQIHNLIQMKQPPKSTMQPKLTTSKTNAYEVYDKYNLGSKSGENAKEDLKIFDNKSEFVEMVYTTKMMPIYLADEYFRNLTEVEDYWNNFYNRPATKLSDIGVKFRNAGETTDKLTEVTDILLPKEAKTPPTYNPYLNKNNLLPEIETPYRRRIEIYPKRTCGIDNSPVSTIFEGSGKLETYPWLGILLYPYENERITTSVVLVTKQIVIGSATEVYKLPKVDFRERASVALGRCDTQHLRVLDYNYHPEYHNDTHNALVIVQIDLTSAQQILRPICAPPTVLTQVIFHAMVLPEDCNSNRNKIKIYEMIQVPSEECKNFYRRSGLVSESTWSKHTACGRARWGGKCVWRSGAALVVKQEGRWHLLGFGVHGPGCQAPARFIDYGMYRRWVADSVARIGRPAITRLGPNHLVLRRTTYKIQRFGPCDKGEVQYELFTDETRIEIKNYHANVGMQTLGKARYNLTIFANSEYSCVIFKASYGPEFGVLATPKLSLRRYCPIQGPICHSGGILHVDFYVEIEYIHPLTFKVLAYGTKATVYDIKSLTRYMNNKRNHPPRPSIILSQF